MGFLNIFTNKQSVHLTRLPSGSFTLDPDGRVMTSTLPQSFPEEYVREISEHVLEAFRTAKESEMRLTEIVVQYAALKIIARELRGGAIIFLMPQVFLPRPKLTEPKLSLP